MSGEPLIRLADELVRSIKLAAAVGASARLHAGARGDASAIAAVVNAISEAVAPAAVRGADRDAAAEMASYISTQLRQALEFIERPLESGGWMPADPDLINEQGKASRVVVREIEAFAVRHEALRRSLAEGRRFLDCGTGAGWIAIEAASRWPTMQVEGIDIWEPSLDLARVNVAGSGLAGRITITKADIAAFSATSAFDLIWVPVPFLPREVLETAMPRLFEALAPGGTLVVGSEREPSAELDRLLLQLDMLRIGGHAWPEDGLRDLMAGSGLENVTSFSLVEPLLMTAGTKPR